MFPQATRKRGNNAHMTIYYVRRRQVSKRTQAHLAIAELGLVYQALYSSPFVYQHAIRCLAYVFAHVPMSQACGKRDLVPIA
jgi:hypothetical protein